MSREENTPYDIKNTEDGGVQLRMHKDTVPSKIIAEIVDNPSTSETDKYRKRMIKSFALGAGLGLTSLGLSFYNKKLLQDPRLGSLLDASASTLKQKELQKLLGAAIVNHATTITTPLAGYYAYKNRDDKKKFRTGVALATLSGGAHLLTDRYLRKTGPMASSINGSIQRIKQLAPDRPEVAEAMASKYKEYLSNARISDTLAGAATIPFMSGAENLHKIKVMRETAEIQGDSSLSEEEKAKKINGLTSQSNLLNKYPYLQGMPFAEVLARHYK